MESLTAQALPSRVLVIDDASPDGTGELADRLAAELSFVEVLHRTEREGLGPAYLAGFRHVLDAGAELVAQIDCDLSHDPEDLPRLVAATAGADLVLGSRYVSGGGTRNWGAVRRAVSRAGCFYARVLLGVPVRDLTGGFKCFRRNVLESIELDRIARGATHFRSRPRTARSAPAFGSRRSRSSFRNAAREARR